MLYSVTDKRIAVSATQQGSNEGLAAESRTEIFAINPKTATKRQVFSDATSQIVLLAAGGAGIVVGGARVFAVAMERQHVATAHGLSAVYELATDGSGKARKIFDIDRFANLFVNPTGAEIGYMPGDSTETQVVIRDTATGKLLHEAELFRRTIEAENVNRIGWLPDGKTIYFALTGGLDDEEALWTTPNSPIGTYLMNEDTGSVYRLAPEATLHPKISGTQPLPDAPAVLIGKLADGRYLFSDSEYGGTGGQQGYLYALDLERRSQTVFPVKRGGDANLAPSGDKLVQTTSPNGDQTQPKFRPTSIIDVGVIELSSGKQSKLFSFSAPDVTNSKGPWINLIGWFEDR